VVEQIKPLVSHGADNGFPSEHATLAALVATLLFFYKRQLGIAVFVASILVGLGRIWAHVHSPLDILGGLICGTLAGATGVWLARYYFGRHKSVKQID
jgi:undecaprenyl-diphosphatase